jgi:tRNA(adenine34) deaminase
VFTKQDSFWMQRALELARASEAAGEVPVGAVLTLDDQMIGEGHNSPIHNVDPTAHAEIVALRHAAVQMNNYRLPNTTLYVTLEPCVMCFGAIVQARVQRVIFGATDPKAGAVCSAFQLEAAKSFNHHPVCHAGLLQDACGQILTNFFRHKRAQSRAKVAINT